MKIVLRQDRVSSPTLNGGYMAMKSIHRTDDEILYIQGIGKHSPQTEKTSRKEILKLYIDGLNLRNDWVGLDKDKVIAFANKELYEAK